MSSPNQVWWGIVRGSVNTSPLHIMVPDADYEWASLCKGRPGDGNLYSGSKPFSDVDECADCLRNAPV